MLDKIIFLPQQSFCQISSCFYYSNFWKLKNRMQGFCQQRTRQSDRSRRHTKKRIAAVKQDHAGYQGQERLKNIINAFRQNNLKLMQKIQECQRIRCVQESMSKKKVIEKYCIQKKSFSANATYEQSKNPYIQIQSDRKIQHNIYKNLRKESMNNIEQLPYSKNNNVRSEQCIVEENYILEDKNVKLVKINLNKLVPLSMDKLKIKLKML